MTEGRCPSSRLSGAHCTLAVGHSGAHMQVDRNGVTGWANEAALIWPSSGEGNAITHDSGREADR